MITVRALGFVYIPLDSNSSDVHMSTSSSSPAESEDDFELELGLDFTDSETNENDVFESWFSPPPPQKFPASACKAQDATSNVRRIAQYKAQACRAIGIMITREETAHWNCSKAEIQNAACAVAELMIIHHF